MKTFILGLGLGAVAGLLLAPKRGERTRAELRERLRRFTRSASDRAARMKTSESGTPAKKSPETVSPSRSEGAREADVEVLNTASREALIAVRGIGSILAERIIENRPYQHAYEVVEKGILPDSIFLQLRRELLDKSA